MAEAIDGESRDLAALVSASVPALLVAMGGTVDDALVEAFSAAVEPTRMVAGETLFLQGDESNAAYFVVTGRLLILIEDEHGQPRVVRRVGRGGIVGEIGLLEGSARTATVTVDRDATLGRLDRESFERIAEEHKGFLMGVTRTVVGRLARPRPQVDSIATIAVAVASESLDRRVFSSRLLHALEAQGDSTLVSAGLVANAIGDASDVLRVEQYLDAAEASNRFVLLETDRRMTEWSRIALRRADRVVVVTGAKPDAAEDALALSFSETAHTGHRPDVWLAVEHDADGLPSGASAPMAQRYGADRVLHFRNQSRPDVHRLARLCTGTGIGLVLGGGGARGFAHLGVYRALTELGVPVDAVAGASIGGIIGAAIATARPPGEITDLAEARFANVLDYTLPLVSMVKGSRITREIDKVFAGVDFEDLPVPFLCVSTNLTTARQTVHESGPITVATRAGLAIPGVIPPVPHDGELLVDGGVLDNLPIGPLRSTGLVDTVIAVDVAPQLGPKARADFGLSVSGWRALRSKVGKRRRTYPGISAVLLRSMIVGSMQRRDDLLAAGMADLYLTPDLRGISLLAFNQVRAVADAGYQAVYPAIEEWAAEREKKEVMV